MSRNRNGEEGIALILALLATVIIFGAITVVVMRVHTAKRMTDQAVLEARLDEACKAAIAMGVERVWHQYVIGNGNTTGNLASYKVFIESVVPDGTDADEDGWPDADSAIPLALEQDLPYTLSSGGAAITSLTINRLDDLSGMNLVLRATAEVGGRTRTVTQTIRIGGAPFAGFEYAVLANNVNCILCHAEFLALDLENNGDPDYANDPSLYGTFDRIKIATLESLLFRTGEAHSYLSGTVYTRGDVRNSNGHPLSASGLASSTFKGHDFDRTNGKILQNHSTGNKKIAALLNADTDEDGMLEQFGNCYQNYPESEEEMTDGALPGQFPAPFPDDDGDRSVGDSEFGAVMSNLSGTLSGGIRYGVPSGDLYSGSALPSSSNGASADLAAAGSYDGNLILVGSDGDPLIIDGDVTVNGDLVIAGPVQGWGTLQVRGNTYIVGDVTYDDAPGEFGTAVDGSDNGLAIVSGGSIMMGDYLTNRGQNHPYDTSKYPNSAFSINVRREHVSGSQKVGNNRRTIDYGYFDPGVVDAGEIQATTTDAYGNTVPRQGQQFSFTTSELMLFNNLELEKAVADPSYNPRFYGLRESQPNNIYTYHQGTEEHAVRYDESGGGVQFLVDYMIQEGYPLDILDDATFHYMNPSQNWLSEDTLRQIWWNDEQTRSASGDPFRFDGLLYSNNAIFAITRSRSRHKSYTDGQMIVRGGIVSPDLGVLIPGNGGTNDTGLTLLYDRRVRRFLEIEDTNQVTFQRLVYNTMPGAAQGDSAHGDGA